MQKQNFETLEKIDYLLKDISYYYIKEMSKIRLEQYIFNRKELFNNLEKLLNRQEDYLLEQSDIDKLSNHFDNSLHELEEMEELITEEIRYLKEAKNHIYLLNDENEIENR